MSDNHRTHAINKHNTVLTGRSLMSQPSEGEAQVIASEERNPYAPSVGVLNASRDPADFVDPHLKLAPRSRRFANSLLDTLCFLLAMFLLGLANAVVHLKFG